MLYSKGHFQISCEFVNDLELVSVGDQGHIVCGIDNRWRQLGANLEHTGVARDP